LQAIAIQVERQQAGGLSFVERVERGISQLCRVFVIPQHAADRLAAERGPVRFRRLDHVLQYEHAQASHAGIVRQDRLQLRLGQLIQRAVHRLAVHDQVFRLDGVLDGGQADRLGDDSPHQDRQHHNG